MPIDVRCPSCNASLPAPDEFAGKKIRCADCNGIVDVPAAAAPAVARPAVARPVTARPVAAAPKPAQPARDADADAPRTRKPKAEWDDDDRPAKDAPKPGVLTGFAMLWLVVVGVLGLTGAGVLAFAAVPATAPPKNPNPPPMAAVNNPPPVVPVPPAPKPFDPFAPANAPPAVPAPRPPDVDDGMRKVVPPPGPPAAGTPNDAFRTYKTVRADGAGLIQKYGNNLRAAASSESGGWGVAKLFDGVVGTAWFSAPGNGGARGDPWVAVAFPEDVTVTKVEIYGCREQAYENGYNVRAGRFDLLDKAGKVLATQVAAPTLAGGKDFRFTPDAPVEGVRAVKFTSTKDEQNNKYVGLSELLVE